MRTLLNGALVGIKYSACILYQTNYNYQKGNVADVRLTMECAERVTRARADVFGNDDNDDTARVRDNIDAKRALGAHERCTRTLHSNRIRKIKYYILSDYGGSANVALLLPSLLVNVSGLYPEMCVYAAHVPTHHHCRLFHPSGWRVGGSLACWPAGASCCRGNPFCQQTHRSIDIGRPTTWPRSNVAADDDNADDHDDDDNSGDGIQALAECIYAQQQRAAAT